MVDGYDEGLNYEKGVCHLPYWDTGILSKRMLENTLPGCIARDVNRCTINALTRIRTGAKIKSVLNLNWLHSVEARIDLRNGR